MKTWGFVVWIPFRCVAAELEGLLQCLFRDEDFLASCRQVDVGSQMMILRFYYDYFNAVVCMLRILVLVCIAGRFETSPPTPKVSHSSLDTVFWCHHHVLCLTSSGVSSLLFCCPVMCLV